ncbi:efflux RND transporter periplasmic adaptor subunit [Bosea sp. (in: a-proteobacteria)]|jgi:Cu(I)/Ag(I) efflux system membrane fusion protein|uniref:efflux RND transporter periplasmic adaptor subunit n=1 Tax=Bosea sp. (in: a-proteobacteria) TaxID=1871050 RepID=UPI002B489287|nr:efflux RND transporter periplasmic adaptor subunit [Bosea sp. (in: a-proteobacteria)]WRH56124.1 MAG: efflux RND transporter periplasmic adaptor subunit [Bosea sp. (in: a-proteobacteria)]
MSRILLTAFALTTLTAVGAAGYFAGTRGLVLPGLDRLHHAFIARSPVAPQAGPAAAAGPIAYYRHPDGAPFYAAEPRKTEDGRDFLPVSASEEISFDPAAAKSAQTVAETAMTNGAERKLLYYRNPMGLPDTSPIPKKDWMGMDYLPVYAGEDADDKVIKLSPGRIQRSGVRSEPVVRQAISRPIRVPGTVQLDERRVSVVATRSDAFIQEVAPVTTGDRVAKGDRLVKIYSPEITAAGAQFVSELNASGRGVPEGGARQRLENLGVQPEIVAEIERTRKVPLTIVWSAPRDGIVLERNVVDGMKMASGDSLFRLADISTIWVLADVPEGDLAAIRIGAPATIRLRGRPGTEFAGKVGLIYPQVAETTRTTKVRIEIDNREGMLLPNMYADVEIGSGEFGLVLAVPDSAVIDTGTRRVVILDLGEGRFEPREVQLGQRGEGMVAISEGVKDGDRVVVSANFLIDAESNLKAALSGLGTPEAKGAETTPAEQKR